MLTKDASAISIPNWLPSLAGSAGARLMGMRWAAAEIHRAERTAHPLARFGDSLIGRADDCECNTD
jgi:hypothetical protein